jgi:hypothetical protein
MWGAGLVPLARGHTHRYASLAASLALLAMAAWLLQPGFAWESWPRTRSFTARFR